MRWVKCQHTPEGTKQCRVCKDFKALSDFHPHKVLSDGLRTECKECHRQETRDYYLRHPDPYRRRAKVQMVTDPDYKQKARIRNVQRYLKIKDERAIYRQQWRHSNMEASREHVRKRRAKLHSAPEITLTVQEWRDVIDSYGHRCVYCKKKFDKLTMDHIVPITRGGSHTKDNVVPACRRCNSHKNANPPPAFQRVFVLGGL